MIERVSDRVPNLYDPEAEGHVTVLAPLEGAAPSVPAPTAPSAQNARKHGILASVLLGEEVKDYRAHVQGLLEHYAPEGYLEGQLLERVASALWRLRRVERWEAARSAVGQKRTLLEWRRALLFEHSDAGFSSVAAEDLRYPLEQSARALALHRLGPEALRGQPAPELMVWVQAFHGVCTIETRKRRAFQRLERELERGFKAVGYRDPEELGWYGADAFMTWPVALDAAQRFAQLACPLGPLPQAWDAYTVVLEEHHTEHQRQLRKAERLEEHAYAQSGLLSGPELDKLSKYEAHLTRTLYKALHELEALQDQRKGRGAPLARLEVHGLER